MGAKLLQDVRQDLADVVQVCEGKKKQTNYLRTLINELVKGIGPPVCARGLGARAVRLPSARHVPLTAQRAGWAWGTGPLPCRVGRSWAGPGARFLLQLGALGWRSGSEGPKFLFAVP